MQLTTPINIPPSAVKMAPTDRILFVGSCFADNIGRRFTDNAFQAEVNPYGVMYNPVSVRHTLTRLMEALNEHPVPGGSVAGLPYEWVIITLGTNHVYREKATGEIVDNCQKRPQKLFQEEVLGVDECAAELRRCLELCKESNVVFTVSPIRYKKYGYHESQLSKATLLLAIGQTTNSHRPSAISLAQRASYFPAYEIVLDELRDYRFYAPDMIHPSEQAVDYIFDRFRETYFSPEAERYFEEYQPIKQALNHKPFNPKSPEYKAFQEETTRKLALLCQKYNL